MRLSVAIICKNEEAMIKTCLESVKEADEIIVCDTGSTDSTLDIVKEYTDNIYTDFKWNDSFADARNHVKSKCTGNWILSIDCDEILEPNGINKIKHMLENINTETVNVNMYSESLSFFFPRLYKNLPHIQWEGDWHNYLNSTDTTNSDIRIKFNYSPTHNVDTNRGIRIGERAVTNHPESARYKFYLAREYMYKAEWQKAIDMFKKYFKQATWAPEWSYGHYLCAQSYNELGNWQEAKNQCLEAIKINTNFKAAIELLAELSGPKNRKRWIEFAQNATNDDVLFVDTPPEQGKEYYDSMFKNNSDMSRYKNIHLKIAGIVGNYSVLDIGCGTAELMKYIESYHGFDFSEEAIKIAKNREQKFSMYHYVWKGSLYDKENYYRLKYGYFVCCEVLEHVDDYKVIKNIPGGSRILFTVPSFSDPSHIRTYTEEVVRIRYNNLIDIKNIIRFNWHGKWVEGGKETNSYILLIEGIKY